MIRKYALTYLTILFFLLISVMMSFTSKSQSVDGSPSLQVIGSDLCDNHGNRFQLKGISTHGLQWFPEFVREDNFRFFRDNWGCNMIRFAMYTEENGYLSSQSQAEKLKSIIDSGISHCTALGMYAIIDWHILSDGNPLTHSEDAKCFFHDMSAKYKDNPYVIYEICNEPNSGTSWSDIKAYTEQVIPVIRANAPEAIILIGTPTWSQDVDQATANPISSSLNHNVMYTLHFYAATHKDWLRNKLISSKNSGLPIFISEFSTCDASGNGAIDHDSANSWFELIKEYNLSFAGWNLSDKAETSAILKPGSGPDSSVWTDQSFTETGLLLKSLISARSA